MTSKEAFDIKTIRYFIPQRNKLKTRITKADVQAMVDLSSRGVQPKQRTKGFQNLLAGKTFRDEQITSYRNDIRDGYITKLEVIESFPEELQPWIGSKIKDVPYDEESKTMDMLTGIFNREPRGVK